MRIAVIAGTAALAGMLSAASAAQPAQAVWNRAGTLPASLLAAPMWGNPMVSAAGNLFACTEKGVYRSEDKGRTWTQAWDSECTRLAAHGEDLFLGKMHQMLRSRDGGKNWEDFAGNLNISTTVTGFAVSGGFIYAGIQSDGVYRSRDGKEWTELKEGLENNIIFALAAQGDHVYAGTPWGIFHSDDAGAHWSRNKQASGRAREIFLHEGSVFASLHGRGVLRSADHGKTWIQASHELDETDIRGFAAMDGIVFAAAREVGIVRYLPEQDVWEAYGKWPSGQAIGLAAVGRCLIAGHSDGSIWRLGPECPK
jgi:photosystem II stability/assembly factor-like uncharacterized protein